MRRSSTSIGRSMGGSSAWTRRRRTDRPPFAQLILLLCSIPGVSVLSATTILAEIGRDMSRFPTAGHLVAWAGLCPGQNESAGKRKSSRLRKGAPWLKTMLVQCAWAAKRQKNSYYAAQFHRLKSRRGPQKAICAVAASMLTADLSHAEERHVHIRISAPTTSIAARPKPKPGVWSPSSPGSASRCNSNRSPKPPDGRAKLSPERRPDRRNPSLACERFLVRSEATKQSRSRVRTDDGDCFVASLLAMTGLSRGRTCASF